MPEPLSTSLLIAVGQQLVRVGIPKLLAMINKQPAVLGARGPYTTRLKVTFRAPTVPRPVRRLDDSASEEGAARHCALVGGSRNVLAAGSWLRMSSISASVSCRPTSGIFCW